MTGVAVGQLALYLVLLVALAVPLGTFMARVYRGEARWMQAALGWLERGLYRACRIRPDDDMPWTRYAMAVMWFSAASFVAVYVIDRLQGHLPLDPNALPAVPPGIAFDTAVSFTTNTNWQAYAGETTMSHLTQMAALTTQNFVSAAVGMAVLVALVRGFTRKTAGAIGNFWVDLTRTVVYILLPLSLVFAIVLVALGVPQTLHGTLVAHTLQHGAQPIAVGPVASQLAIKQLGTNGGGYFNANSAHPFENPTALANLLECLAILALSAALCVTFGRLAGARRQGAALLAAMFLIFVPVTVVTIAAEQQGTPALAAAGADQAASALQGGGNLEGKEVRFGSPTSAIWATATTAASNGSVDAMHDSFTPLGGLFPLWLIQLGEVVFGGVGCGLYGMILFAIVAVFLAGLMVGRTPELLGKKIEAFEMKMATIGILLPSVCILIGTAIAVATHAGTATTTNAGPHGFSEILYGFSSASGNNGSAFAGLGAATDFYTAALGICMWLGRFVPLLAVLAIAGSLAAKKHVPPSSGTLPTDGPLFVVLLVGVVILVGALTFLPALGLGPIVEHLRLMR